MSKLFSPYTLAGGINLKNRIIMAPLTRARAQEDKASERIALYYAQRATAGLIVSEGTAISRQGQGYLFNPSIYTEEKVKAWQLVTNTVHDLGGKIFAQIWHVGRVSNTTILEEGQVPVGPSAQIAEGAKAFGYDEDGNARMVDVSQPRALTIDEVHQTVEDYAKAAENSIKAGFDGIEIHGANGYLIDQFMNPKVNDRDDKYGAKTMEDRLRFTLEVVDAVIDRIGADKTAIRLSPYVRVFDMPLHDEIDATFIQLAKELAKRNLAYVHFMDHTRHRGPVEGLADKFVALLRKMRAELKTTPFIVAGEMTRERAEQWIEEDIIDLAAFGRGFISNPDLVARLEHNWPLAEADKTSFYGGDGHGYIDYPPYNGEK